MDLIIDQGNTLTKLAFYQGDNLIGLHTYEHLTGEALIKVVEQVESQNPESGKVKNCILSSVAEKSLDFPGELQSKLNILKLNHLTPLPITNRYKTPETLGNDRIALVVGASGMFSGNLLVIDAGTCITFDFINANREYLGGSISPGIKMRFKALNTFTGKLPLVSDADHVELVGQTTETCIRSGVITGTLAEVKGIIGQYELEYPGITVIITGGDMKYFDKFLKSNIFAVSNLVVTGLKDILKYNLKK